MKYGIVLSAFFLLTSFVGRGQTYSLTIKISNIKETKGKVHIGLFNKEEGFLKKGMAFKNALVEANANTVTHTFTGLAPGYYSVTMYHDENNDGHCNRNFIGIPIEAYGFSNNVRPRFSAPTFDQTKIQLKGNTEVVIKLIN